MTDQQRDDANLDPGASAEVAVPATTPELLSRRALLRGATIAAPTILSLSSATAAAVALSSTRIYTGVANAQPDSDFHCLSESSTLGPADGVPNSLEVGATPTPEVYAIPDRDYRVAADPGAATATEFEMCRDGGDYYYYQDPNWPGVRVQNGILMSGAAQSSLGISSSLVENI